MKHFARAARFVLPVLLLAMTAQAQEDQQPQRPVITPERYDVTIRSLGSSLNSSDDDFAPLLLGNGKVLYFTSNRNGDQDIFSAVQGSDGWEQVQAAGPALNTDGDEGGTTITPDGRWMVFTACDRMDGLGDCDLYIAEYIGGSWRNIRNLGPNVNSPAWDSQPSISPDGLMLFFVSERPGGQGGTDVWMTTRSHDGDFGRAVNLGSVVNSVGDEIAPHIAADNTTLYFSSDTHPGIGGQDVYRVKKSDRGWSSPQHLGTPINSEYDDYFCSLRLNSDDLYFTSNRPGGSGDLDIYLAIPNPLPPGGVTTVLGTVTDSRSDNPIGASLTVRDISTNEVLSTFYSDEMDGSYVVVLQPGRQYVITAEAPGYLFYSDRFDVPAGSANDMVRKDIKMTRDIVRLLVYFDFDKATLQSASFVDLDRAVDWLKANPTVKVELAGHTDNVGSREYNKKLSLDRAQAVLDYLVKKGISPARVTAHGYGMSEPVATNETDEGRALNRRVEFRVVSR
ncbi:MAG: PD40 domain-containing protein [Bacteroidetes bacterium]|nr:PD40 domain-containing protein [Bacteroidota bacterium]